MLWLEDYLVKWPKTLLVVSHAREFLNQVATDILHLHSNKIITYKVRAMHHAVRIGCGTGRRHTRQGRAQLRRLSEHSALCLVTCHLLQTHMPWLTALHCDRFN